MLENPEFANFHKEKCTAYNSLNFSCQIIKKQKKRQYSGDK